MSESESDWLTYAEAGRVLGITPEAVRARSKRLEWPKRLPNAFGAPTRIKIPNEFRTVRPVTDSHNRPVTARTNGAESTDMIARAVRAGAEAASAPLIGLVDGPINALSSWKRNATPPAQP